MRAACRSVCLQKAPFLPSSLPRSREIADRFRERPGLNVNNRHNGLVRGLPPSDEAGEGSARLQKVVNFLRVIIRLRGFAASDLALSRPFLARFVSRVCYFRAGQAPLSCRCSIKQYIYRIYKNNNEKIYSFSFNIILIIFIILVI